MTVMAIGSRVSTTTLSMRASPAPPPHPGNGVDWVFSYGDLLSLKMFGRFRVRLDDATPPQAGAETVEAAEDVLTGTPSDSFLPRVVRNHIDDFMRTVLRVEQPAVLLVHRARWARPELSFNLHQEGFSTEEELQETIGRLRWFLPSHYPINVWSRDTFPADAYTPLAEPGATMVATPVHQAPTPERNESKPWYKFW